MHRRTFTALAIVCALGSVGLLIAGFAAGPHNVGRGTHGGGSFGYFAGSLLAVVLTGVFTFLGLTTGPRDR